MPESFKVLQDKAKARFHNNERYDGVFSKLENRRLIGNKKRMSELVRALETKNFPEKRRILEEEIFTVFGLRMEDVYTIGLPEKMKSLPAGSTKYFFTMVAYLYLQGYNAWSIYKENFLIEGFPDLEVIAIRRIFGYFTLAAKEIHRESKVIVVENFLLFTEDRSLQQKITALRKEFGGMPIIDIVQTGRDKNSDWSLTIHPYNSKSAFKISEAANFIGVLYDLLCKGKNTEIVAREIRIKPQSIKNAKSNLLTLKAREYLEMKQNKVTKK